MKNIASLIIAYFYLLVFVKDGYCSDPECNGHGDNVKNKCICHDKYYGNQCELSANDVINNFLSFLNTANTYTTDKKMKCKDQRDEIIKLIKKIAPCYYAYTKDRSVMGVFGSLMGDVVNMTDTMLEMKKT